jgi:hypothetical protein
MGPTIICYLYSVKNHKLANTSTTTEAREKSTPSMHDTSDLYYKHITSRVLPLESSVIDAAIWSVNSRVLNYNPRVVIYTHL